MKNILIFTMLLSGCNSKQQHSFEEYLSLYRPATEIKLDDRTANFVYLYKNLKQVSAADAVAKTYAEDLYFNDTLVTLHKRSELITYLENTQKQLQDIDLVLLNVLFKGEDVYLHWEMRTVFKVLAKTSDVRTTGMSHLRFDQQNKIILHQDYWDSTTGFFQHIPLIGNVLKWIKVSLY